MHAMSIVSNVHSLFYHLGSKDGNTVHEDKHASTSAVVRCMSASVCLSFTHTALLTATV